MSSKSDTALRQVSIRAALDFLEVQKASSEKQWNIRRVALEYGLAPQTLRDAVIKGAVPNRPGPPTVLTAEEEEELVGYYLNMQKLGFGLTKAAVNTMIMKIIKEQHRRHPFKTSLRTLGGSVYAGSSAAFISRTSGAHLGARGQR